ncbi:TPA: methylenetetrahydrofolate--tRNA-(uracil-5-)-methyltransferase [Corynebacterium striatum]|nr:methylenetetrahydrofolate--tRNA-(uracil-5-)-methyltransferase [Corynebacterium striatum]
MQRVAIVGDGPAALSTAERLIGSGMCVDLICAKPAPFGLLRRFAGLAGARHEAATSPCPAGTTPRLRLFGNVRVGTGPKADITARGVAFTSWEGLCQPIEQPEDWATVTRRAQLAPVCF